MAKKHMKKMVNITNFIREMHIKTTMRYHITPARMAIIEKSINTKCWRGCGEKAPYYTVSGNVNWCNHCGKQYGDSSEN